MDKKNYRFERIYNGRVRTRPLQTIVPEKCPSCKQTCTFSDVTCYIPDCGGPGNIDPRLVGKKDKSLNE
jgi:hypothetical protein